MARDTESTMQWKLDIANLKKGMQDARQQISLANAEFKNATAGMGKWSDSATGVEAKTKQLAKVLEGQKTILGELKGQYEIVAREMGEASPEAQKLKVQIENQEAACKKTEAQLSGYNAKLGELQAQEAESNTAFAKLTGTIDEQETQLKTLKDEYVKAAINFGENSTEAKELAGQITELSGELAENKAKLDGAASAADDFDTSIADTKGATEDASEGFTVMKGALADLVAKGIELAIEGLKNLASTAYEAWQSYDEGADTIIAATGATGEAADDLMNAYRGVAGSIVADFSDIGTAVGEVSTRFGVTGDELQGLSEDFLKFSQLNEVDLKKAIDGTQSAMAAWGVEAQDATLMLDVLNRAGQTTGVSVDTLAQSMVTNAPALQELGYSASDAAMFLASLEKNGVDTSATMAGMKRALANASAEGKPMSQAMAEIEDKIKNASTSTEAITEATELFGSKAGASIANAVRSGKLSFAELGTSMEDFEGNLNQTFEDTLDAPDKLAIAMQGVQAELADMAGQLMEEFGPQIEQAFEYTQETLIPTLKEAISWFIRNLPTIGAAVAGIVAGLAAAKIAGMVMTAVEAVKKWKAATEGMTIAQKLLNAAQMANPIGIVVGLIAGLVAAVLVLWHTNEDFRKKVLGLWDKIKSYFSKVIPAITKFFTVVVPNALKSMLAWFQQLPGKIGGFITSVLTKVKTWAANMATKATEAGRTFLNNVVSFFTQLPGKIGGFLVSVWEKAKSWVTSMATQATQAGKKFLDNVVNKIKELPGKVGGHLVAVWEKAKSWVTSMATQATNAGSKFLNNVVNKIKQLPGKVGGYLVSVWDKASSWVTSMATKATEAGSKFLNNVANKITQLPGKVGGFLSDVIGRVGTWASDLGEKGASAAKKLFDNVVNGLTGLPDRIKSIGSDLVKGLWNGINDMTEWVISKIQGFGDSVLTGLKNFFGIKSPSRVMRDEVGKMLAEGIAVGFGEEMPDTLGSMKKDMRNTVDALRGSVTLATEGTRGKGAAVAGREAQAQGGTVQNITFKQYNTSPKALDHLSIYRDTSSLLFSARVGLKHV